MKVEADRLRKVLGIARMSFHDIAHPIAITDLPLEADAPPAATRDIAIDNFRFSPSDVSVPAGTTVRWTNRDDIPHTIVCDDRTFKSPVLDTDGVFSRQFAAPGTFRYFCSIHPMMTGAVVVT